MAVRRPARALVVLAGGRAGTDAQALTLAAELGRLRVQAMYLGREDDPARVAAAVCHRDADSVELCLGAESGARFVLQLLRELRASGRRDVSIVVHRLHI